MFNSNIVQVIGKCRCGQNFVKYVQDEIACEDNYYPNCPNCLKIVMAYKIIDPLEISLDVIAV